MSKDKTKRNTAYFHLPGLFEFYELYRIFLSLFHEHREYFYDWCEIGSIYGAPSDCIWGGGRVEDETCDGVIIHSELLLDYLKENYPKLYFISSTTKVLTDFEAFRHEVERDDFRYVVPDFRLNKQMDQLDTLTQIQKDKVEFLCNECCWFGCKDRRNCYEAVSRRNLGVNAPEHHCKAPAAEQGYRFSKAMTNPGFIGIDDIQNIYIPMGFSNFKIEGRGLGSALVLEFLLYYMTKPEYQLNVREAIYLDNMLDLF